MREFKDLSEMELRDLLQEMGRRITTISRSRGVEKPLFLLLVFNNPTQAQYLSNCQRADAVKALRETADRIEGREESPRVPLQD